MTRVSFCLLALFLLPTTVFGEIQSIQLPMQDSDSKKAFFVSPSGNGKFPAIVYMHGGAAREKSDPSFFKEKILDYSSMGFVVLAPQGATVDANHESEAQLWVRPDELAGLGADSGLHRLAANGLALARSING